MWWPSPTCQWDAALGEASERFCDFSEINYVRLRVYLADIDYFSSCFTVGELIFFPIRMFLSVRSSDCDSDSILESNQKNSKNQSIHLFWLLGEREGSSSDCFHLNDFYFSLQLGILSLQFSKNKKQRLHRVSTDSAFLSSEI